MSSEHVIELPRKRATSIVSVFIGGVFLLCGAIVHIPMAGRGFFLGLGALLAGLGLLRLFARTPRFRADERGVWFGGGPVIVWTDIKAVFEVNMNVKGRDTTAIAFELQRRGLLFKTPVENWLAAPFAVGDIDISPSTTEWTSVLAARLEAMRTRATA